MLTFRVASNAPLNSGLWPGSALAWLCSLTCGILDAALAVVSHRQDEGSGKLRGMHLP